jgi:glutathione S-transferase
MKLYFHPLSGHSHRVRLFLSLLGITHSLVEIDLFTKAQKSPEFLAISPFGQLPVLDDDGEIFSDSNAILVYLAKKFGKTDWLPESPAAASRVQRWLSVAAGELMRGPASARLINVFGAKLDAADVIARAHALFKLMEAALEGHDWIIAGAHPTLADIALYSYTARAPEGDVDLASYPLIRAWLQRIEALPGFVPFQQTLVGLTAPAG